MASGRTDLIEIDLTGVKDAQELHLLLMDTLGFPGYSGCNWNAFRDTISGIVQMPRMLRLRGWRALEKRLPEDAQLMQDCLNDLAARYPEEASEVEYV
jgi:RNAse (barnase) inhibitor barstar